MGSSADEVERTRRRIVQLAYGLQQAGAPGKEALTQRVPRKTRILRRKKTKQVPWRRGWPVGTHPWHTPAGVRLCATYVREDGTLVARTEEGDWVGPEGLADDAALNEIVSALQRVGGRRA
jgi:hypothetical protein